MEPFAPGRICNLQPKQPPEEFDQWVLFFAFIVMFVLLIFMGWQLTPTLVSDFKIANAQKVTASDVTIEEAMTFSIFPSSIHTYISLTCDAICW